ncbi:MAG TPA: hypothetical protein VI796_03770 [Candidatus Thermoplasmatota archaeon]|nr:hypothetical protein [Candidatus Thermoplasmatota archaeon]
MSPSARTLLPALLAIAALAGCLGGGDDASSGNGGNGGGLLPIETGLCVQGTGGPPAPPGEEVVGVQPVDLIFGGSLRHANTRVLLVPPGHGDLGEPMNMSRSALSYLAATLEGIFSWEPAIDHFIANHTEFAYLDNVTVQVEVFEQEVPETAGYDIIIGYAETSGPVFRGIAIDPDDDAVDLQGQLDQAGLGDVAHLGNRYVLLSLFASAPRSGQGLPDYPETPEVRGVTMHEFAHVWGLGHSTTWTFGCGSDLMNSPYAYVYGDGDPAGDGGERSRPLCISSLDLYGLAYLYRWMPNGTWEGSAGNASLPPTMVYEEYCVHEEAAARAEAYLAERGLEVPPTVSRLTDLA